MCLTLKYVFVISNGLDSSRMMSFALLEKIQIANESDIEDALISEGEII